MRGRGNTIDDLGELCRAIQEAFGRHIPELGNDNAFSCSHTRDMTDRHFRVLLSRVGQGAFGDGRRIDMPDLSLMIDDVGDAASALRLVAKALAETYNADEGDEDAAVAYLVRALQDLVHHDEIRLRYPQVRCKMLVLRLVSLCRIDTSAEELERIAADARSVIEDPDEPVPPALLFPQNPRQVRFYLSQTEPGDELHVTDAERAEVRRTMQERQGAERGMLYSDTELLAMVSQAKEIVRPRTEAMEGLQQAVRMFLTTVGLPAEATIDFGPFDDFTWPDLTDAKHVLVRLTNGDEPNQFGLKMIADPVDGEEAGDMLSQLFAAITGAGRRGLEVLRIG